MSRVPVSILNRIITCKNNPFEAVRPNCIIIPKVHVHRSNDTNKTIAQLRCIML